MKMELLNAILKLETKVAVHRRETILTCEEKCWCWDAEALLIALQRANEDPTDHIPSGDYWMNGNLVGL